MTEEQQPPRQRNRINGDMMINFGGKHYGHTFAVAYEDRTYRDWYARREHYDEMKKFKVYCLQRMVDAGE